MPETRATRSQPELKRILYICHDAQYYGAQQSLRLILKHLPQHGVECHVSVARSGPLEEELSKEPGIVLHRHHRVQWVKHDRRGLFSRFFMDPLHLLAQSVWRPWQLVRLIKKNGIDLVHTNSAVSLEGAIAARLAGVPHVWHIREIFMMDSPKFQPVLGRKLMRNLIDALSDRVICISGAVQQQFGIKLAQNPKRYPVIYNAVEPIKMLPPRVDAPSHTPFRIGYVGRLSAGKRFHDLVEAMRILKTKKIEPELVVAGTFVDQPYERRIQDMLTQYRLDRQVTMRGYVSDPAELYGELDLLVVPSLNEPFGRVLIEAMQYGVPCVASDSGGVPEIITHGETGLLYPPGDTPVLAGLLEKIILHPEQMIAIRRSARHMVDTRFNSEDQIRRLLQCYADLLDERQATEAESGVRHANAAK